MQSICRAGVVRWRRALLMRSAKDAVGRPQLCATSRLHCVLGDTTSDTGALIDGYRTDHTGAQTRECWRRALSTQWAQAIGGERDTLYAKGRCQLVKYLCFIWRMLKEHTLRLLRQ